jgi:hypothetical protein
MVKRIELTSMSAGRLLLDSCNVHRSIALYTYSTRTRTHKKTLMSINNNSYYKFKLRNLRLPVAYFILSCELNCGMSCILSFINDAKESCNIRVGS